MQTFLFQISSTLKARLCCLMIHASEWNLLLFFFIILCNFFQVMPLGFDEGIFPCKQLTSPTAFPSLFMQYKFSHKQHFAQQHITYECRLPELFIAEQTTTKKTFSLFSFSFRNAYQFFLLLIFSSLFLQFSSTIQIFINFHIGC